MAKRITDEDLRLNLIVNGDGGRKEMLALDRQMKDLQSSTKRTRTELKNLEKAGKTGSQEHQNLTKTLKDQEKTLTECREKYNKLRDAVSLENKTLAELRNHLKLTQTALSKAVPGTENWKKLNAEVQQTKARLKELTSQSGQTRGALEKLSSVKAGALAAFAAIAGAVRGVARAFQKIVDFEQANVNLSTIIGKNVKDIEALTYSAMELGRTTEYTASQVTLLQTELAKLGFKEGAIMQMQESVLHFATAIGTTLPEAAAMAGATLRMFGLDAKDTTDTLGVLVQGANNSALSFSYYQTAMATVGPVAKTFGFSLRDTVALLGTLANAGFDASSAATATRNILLNLADSSGKLAVALGKPVSTFPELMSGLRQLKAQGVDLNTTLELTDKRSVSAFNTFLDGADAALALRDSLEDVNGVLKNTAEERVNTVEGSVKLLQSAWEGLILSFKDSTGPIKEVIDWLTKLIEVTSDLVSSGSKQSFYKDFSEDFARKLEDFHGNEEVMKSYIKEARKIYEKGLSQAQATYDNQSGFSRWWHYSGDKLNIARNALEGFDLAAAQYQNASGGGAASSSSPSGSTPPSNPPSPQNPQKNKSLWSLSNDEAFLTAKAELTRRYNEKEISSQEEYNERLYQLEVATLTARLAARKDSGAARSKIEGDLQEKIKKHSDDALKRQQENEKKAGELAKEGAAVIAAAETDKTKAALAAEETRYAAELKKFKDTKVLYENQAAVLEAIEKKHQNALLKIKQEAFDREQSKLETKHNIERQEIMSLYSGKIAQESPNSKNVTKFTKEKDYALVESDLAYLTRLMSQLEKIKDEGGIDGIKFQQDELDKYLLKLEQTKTKIAELTTQKNKSDGGVFSGTGKGSLFGVSQDQWNEFFANLKTGKDKAESLSIALNAVGGFAQEGFQLASKAIELTNAKENKAFNEYKKNNEKKKKDLKSRYDAGLVSQEQYNARVEEMEAEEEAKREEMEIKQAKRTKALNLVQSIINTALSVTKTLAQWGWPAGAAPAAIVAAFGAAQTALIAAQPIGAEEGGFVNTRRAQDGKAFKARLSPDKRGFVSSPTVLVGENGGEYVIPADGLSNPTLLPFVATMEEARKAGTLKSLNFEAVYPVGAAIGRESGGFTNTSTSPVTGIGSGAGAVVSARSATDEKLLEAIELLNKRLSVPIKADVSMLGKNGIIEQTEKYNRAKRRSTYGR
jgi:TP901 family phage tail tape measure protein|nr:MAG TPA: minor tail protein [Caudoviricetes sp.]